MPAGMSSHTTPAGLRAVSERSKEDTSRKGDNYRQSCASPSQEGRNRRVRNDGHLLYRTGRSLEGHNFPLHLHLPARRFHVLTAGDSIIKRHVTIAL
jgi:hypothetical protein